MGSLGEAAAEKDLSKAGKILLEIWLIEALWRSRPSAIDEDGSAAQSATTKQPSIGLHQESDQEEEKKRIRNKSKWGFGTMRHRTMKGNSCVQENFQINTNPQQLKQETNRNPRPEPIKEKEIKKIEIGLLDDWPIRSSFASKEGNSIPEDGTRDEKWEGGYLLCAPRLFCAAATYGDEKRGKQKGRYKNEAHRPSNGPDRSIKQIYYSGINYNYKYTSDWRLERTCIVSGPLTTKRRCHVRVDFNWVGKSYASIKCK